MEDMVTLRRSAFGDAFRGVRVFMTGHTGFKGGWLTLWLSLLGAEVRGFSLEPPSEPNLFTLAGLEADFAGVRGDIRDLPSLERAMRAFAPDLVVHMAAQPLVRRSYAEPVETFATNVMGTVHVLQAAGATDSVRAVINVTSDKCYENAASGAPFRESDPMGGFDPYSASKGCAELAARAWSRSFFSDGPLLASVRAGNVIGGGDFGEDRLAPDMARAFSQGEAVHIRSPQAVRPWQFVLEPLSGYLTLASRLLDGDARMMGGWNFGPSSSDSPTVGEVVRMFADRWGGGATYRLDEGDHLPEAPVLRLDCAKAERELGWTPRTSLATALDWSVEWYRAWASGGSDLRALTEAQIRRFEAL